MRHLWERWRDEVYRVVRFGFIGGLSFLLYTAFYVLESRVIWPSGPRVWQNLIAIVLSTFFNFYAHRHWTFRAKRESWPQLFRYLVTVVTATALQTFLFWLGHEVLEIYDLIVVVLVTGLIACYTYCLHRFFTFGVKKEAEREAML
jgi:putative flippase GtrA